MKPKTIKCNPEWHPKDADKSLYAGEIVSGISISDRPNAGRRRKAPLDADKAVEGIENGNTALLARAITMVESEATAHKEIAREVVRRCLPASGKSIRVGITGTPGAGKSTFIECLGKKLCAAGHKLAVLAVDPSSSVSGGSILGDKTRMEELSRMPNVFIRPSPSGCTLGGVAAKTRESILLCEAAGYDVILVETVGVGQSEVAVRSMVDFFLLLQIAGAGDELQGIKKGVIEMADAIVVTKADGNNVTRARAARSEYERVMRFLHPYTPKWKPKAMACSSVTGEGVDEIWEMITGFEQFLKENGVFESRRAAQNSQWFKTLLEESALRLFYQKSEVKGCLSEVRDKVAAGELTVMEAVERVLQTY
ncbi:methylmalonyl Co-A mutase-associated GTPase MeaB [Pelagicoccus sp. SDUM812003]|uniref:methylmalonyl Co-A mutase-associated GTPase MeaB n=1 Tax=Pelagicoccus sp. SDUM812003 TaxID=3041267 RepID=UPI00280DD1C2|nr:methylmalonyl Co-A mutase-associated GTPase MeaB [Pelagicoccus sp. SDUM812003]MDQ8203800.1 methylmalonyl Co-A mutase-associated GTPase MeaB [Pelagicoccus sp. SDUM812003]